MSTISSNTDFLFRIDANTGLLDSVRFLPSSHCDDRPSNMTIDMIVIHGISLPPGEFDSGAIEDFFCGTLNFAQHPYFAIVELFLAQNP